MFQTSETFGWIVLFAPLLAAGVITLFTRRNPRLSAQISIGASILAFFTTVVLFIILRNSDAGTQTLPRVNLDWINLDDPKTHLSFFAAIGLRLDFLSLTMALIVTGVGSVIHIFSTGYMKGDPAYSRYFACLSLFMFSMLGIVLADNFLMMFIFWELVGVSSYLLIGFWYEREAAADAAKKAFLTNRLGDFGFLLGILLIWATLGHNLDFDLLGKSLENHPDKFAPVATIAGLLIFCGAVGKSGQFPLHVWLPDAMEGPTPVSALIHAATMVAAGIYMLCRVFFLLNAPGSHALDVIAWTGGFTALLSAVIAIQQNDIKRILAYSTLSQLGYMVMAVGLSGPTPAMFHLATHAFFKALLFLGAGSVIYSLHHEQNIWKMGALARKMPVTTWTFLAGTLALCGIWPLSGFYSKDSILAQALARHNVALFVLGVVVAMLTTFYMFRLVFVVFFGTGKSDAAGQAHESPSILIWPLRILAVFAVIGGFIGLEALFAKAFGSETGVAHDFGERLLEPFSSQPLGAFFGLGAVIFGLAMAWAVYAHASTDPLPSKLGWLSRAMRNRFYFDELYQRVLIPCTQGLLSAIAGFIEWVISGFCVRGVHGTTDLAGRGLRMFQTGNLQTYAFLLVAGIALVLYLVLAG